MLRSLILKSRVFAKYRIRQLNTLIHQRAKFDQIYQHRKSILNQGCWPIRYNQQRSYYQITPRKINLELFKNVVSGICLIYVAYSGYVNYYNIDWTDYEALIKMEPVELPTCNADILALNYRRVRLRGVFEHQNERFLSKRPNLTQKTSFEWSFKSSIGPREGYHLLTPIVLEDGRRFLVNRGWLSKAAKDSSRRRLGQVEGPVEFTAFVMTDEKLNFFYKFSSKISQRFEGPNTDSTLDLKSLASKLNVESEVFLVADQSSTIRNGPIGGQIIVPERFVSFVDTVTMAIIGIGIRFVK